MVLNKAQFEPEAGKGPRKRSPDSHRSFGGHSTSPSHYSSEFSPLKEKAKETIDVLRVAIDATTRRPRVGIHHDCHVWRRFSRSFPIVKNVIE